MTRIGLVSDTHGLLRPQVLDFLAGSDRIVHAGDIGDEAILQQLGRIAPVTTVRGNNDRERWAQHLPSTALVEYDGVVVHLLHDLKQLALDPRQAGVRVIVCGHSHRPRIERCRGVLHVNPGSAGPRRFRLPVSVAWLHIDNGQAEARIVELAV